MPRAFKNFVYVPGPGDFDPPEPDGSCVCPTCDGKKTVHTPETEDFFASDDECPQCEGTGFVDENGASFDPDFVDDGGDYYADREYDRM
jgi:hypothetical protein